MTWNDSRVSCLTTLWRFQDWFYSLSTTDHWILDDKAWLDQETCWTILCRSVSTRNSTYNRGFIVKDGFKFGSDFILYHSDGKKHEHGFALVLVHDNQSTLPVQQEVASFVRMADSVKKLAYYVVCSLQDVVKRIALNIRLLFCKWGIQTMHGFQESEDIIFVPTNTHTNC